MIHQGDCLEVMRTLADNSVHAVITDPPYFLTSSSGSGFMGKEWDSAKDWFSVIRFHRSWLRECYRVMKPGATLFAFAGTRTDDLLKLAARLAGFEIRDTLLYLYGAGFPKAQDLGAIYDKDACREQLTEQLGRPPTKAEFKKAWEKFRVGVKPGGHIGVSVYGGDADNENELGNSVDHCVNKGAQSVGLPATDLAREWDGWKVGGLFV